MIRWLIGVALAVPGVAFGQDRLDFDVQDQGATEIIGVEHRPDFTVLIDRENLSKAYDFDLKESFVPKISETVRRDPF